MPRINVFHGERFAYSVDLAQALKLARASNVEIVRRRRKLHRLVIHDTPSNDRNKRHRREYAVAVAEDSQTTYREHIGGETHRPAVIIQHKRAHLGDEPADELGERLYLEHLATVRLELMPTWRQWRNSQGTRSPGSPNSRGG